MVALTKSLELCYGNYYIQNSHVFYYYPMAGQVEYCGTCNTEREVLRPVEDPLDKDRKLITLVCHHTFGKIVKVAKTDRVEFPIKLLGKF